MGSSTTSTSEATINTSTESASTLVTNVTATDTSETYDSLDLGKLIIYSENEINHTWQVLYLISFLSVKCLGI